MPLIGLIIAGAFGAIVVAAALWIGEHWDDPPRKTAATKPDRRTIRDGRPLSPREPRSPMELYLEGGGDLSNPRVAALLAEAERGWNRRDTGDANRAERTPPSATGPLHAHEVTPADAALIRMMHRAHFGPDATVTLPSGRTITGTEMQQWIDANGD